MGKVLDVFRALRKNGVNRIDPYAGWSVANAVSAGISSGYIDNPNPDGSRNHVKFTCAGDEKVFVSKERVKQ